MAEYACQANDVMNKIVFCWFSSPKSNKINTSVKFKASGNSKLNDSPALCHAKFVEKVNIVVGHM